ncbi:zinc finger, CCHC-type containing protein [Tanacetum coccineum]|uniref:Zinc finger, CCHC-type containing protein n=1 Tax=Tanacetum coccineum TaxID=301880 RepID=A0ABQ5EX56_9ASTR
MQIATHRGEFPIGVVGIKLAFKTGGAIEKKEQWKNDDYVCRGIILNGMSDFMFDIYQNVESGKELWDFLEVKYTAKDASNFKHTLKHKNEELTFVELGSHLRIEESLTVQDSDKPKGNNVAGPSVVNMVEHNNSTKYNDNMGKRKHQDTKADPNKKSKVTCWKCGKPGHLKKDCKGGKVGNKANGSGTNGLVNGSSNSDDDVGVVSDLRSNIRVCKDRMLVKTYESLNDGSILHMGNESTALVHGRGCVDLRFSYEKIVSLFNVLHVPNIRKNLVSSSVWNNYGYKQVIESNKFVLSKHGVFIGFGYLSNQIVCHVHFKRMQDMSKDGLIPAFEMDTENDLCDLHATPLLGNKKYFVTLIDDASSLPEKWLTFSQGLRNANHTQTLDLADVYGSTPISTAFFSNNVIQGFQENSDDEVDERSSQKANENTECYKCGNKGHFVRDCFSKMSEPSYKSPVNNYSSVSKGFQPNFTLKLIQFSSNSNNQADPKFQKDYKAEYKKMKAKLALLEASPSSSQNPKTFQSKNKCLVAETFDWDEEEVSNEEEVTQVKVLMALANDELIVGKSHARNGKWVDITIRKVNTLLSMDEDSDWQNYLKYINIDLKFVEEQRLTLLSKYNKMVFELNKCRDEILILKQAKLDAVTFLIQNTKITKLNHALQEQLKANKKINEKWLTS